MKLKKRHFVVTILFVSTICSSAGAKKSRPKPIHTYTATGLPNIQAHSALIVDLETGTELYRKNHREVRPIASISKLFATLAIIDRPIDAGSYTAITQQDADIARGGARSRLLVGMRVSNQDLLHAALLGSDNRAVNALGRASGLTTAELVARMNQKAAQLGLAKTHFADPVGLDPRNVSTAEELVRLLRAVSGVDALVSVARKPVYAAHPERGGLIEYRNTDLVAREKATTVVIGKTGYTDEARYCLAIVSELPVGTGAPAHKVAMVFLGAEGKLTRFADYHRAAEWLSHRHAPVVPIPAADDAAPKVVSAGVALPASPPSPSP